MWKDALENYAELEDPLAAVVEYSLANELELLGWIEPTIFWLGGLLVSLSERINTVNRLAWKAGFTCPKLQWTGESRAIHILLQRRDASYMQLV